MKEVLDLVDLVELLLEHKEVSAFLALSRQRSFLVLLKGVDHLKEVALVQEKLIIFRLNLLNNRLCGKQQSVLLKVATERVGLVSLELVESSGLGGDRSLKTFLFDDLTHLSTGNFHQHFNKL